MLNVVTRKDSNGRFRSAVACDSPMRSVIRVWCGEFETRGKARHAAIRARNELQTHLKNGGNPHWV